MNTLLLHIKEHSPQGPDSALIIGAGNGSQLATLRQLGLRRLLLAEAHPRLADELGKRARPEQGETVLAVAVTPDEQATTTLLPINNLAFSSLNVATELFTHYPNLRAGDALQVPACSIEQLGADQAFDAEQTNLLWIAAPGQAMQLLQSTPPGMLHAFAWLVIDCSSEPLYKGDADAVTIAEWLQTVGYDGAVEDSDAIYPLSRLLFKRNAFAVERFRLLGEIATLKADRQQLASRNQQKLDGLQEQVRQRDESLAEQAKQVTTQQAQIDAAEKEKAEFVQTISELKQEGLVQAKELDEKAKLAHERQDQIDALTKEKKELQSVCDGLNKEKAELKKAREDQSKLASDSKAQLEKITADLDHAKKSNADLQQLIDTTQQRVKTLEEEASVNLLRQQLLQEELIKAEAQIELIKDLLLRESWL